MVRPKDELDAHLTQIYEEWVAYPDKRDRVPFADHQKQSFNKGWFVSGWRGMGPDMEPLPELLQRRFSQSEENDDTGA